MGTVGLLGGVGDMMGLASVEKRLKVVDLG